MQMLGEQYNYQIKLEPSKIKSVNKNDYHFLEAIKSKFTDAWQTVKKLKHLQDLSVDFIIHKIKRKQFSEMDGQGKLIVYTRRVGTLTLLI